MTSFTIIECALKKAFDSKLVDELLAAYRETKENFYLGGLRLSAVEGGRFCEAAFRLLEQIANNGAFTPLGSELKTEKIIATVAQAKISDAIRLHIPRSLRVVYDIRNKRDAAHLADGIDPNEQDASLVVGVLDWVLAEFVRLYHNVTADVAQKIINDLVARRAPAVQNFQGFLKILNPQLIVSDRILLLLYECGPTGATYKQLFDWLHPKMRKNLKRTLEQLEHDRLQIHSTQNIIHITNAGTFEVERKKLHKVNF